MPDKRRININDAPKWFKALYIFAPVIGLILVSLQLDNDFYFIYKTGEQIITSGFPHSDFLSMHSSMHIIAQQWLSAVIYYFLYSKLGVVGAIGFVYICYGLFCVTMHKLCVQITDNLFIGCVFAFIADMLAAVMFEKTRPQAITMLLIALELYLLESFVKKGKMFYLFFLPVISLALINLHAAMWPMLFVFAAPYVAASLPLKLGKINQEPCCSFVKLLICGAVCFAVGFANPYGWEAMTYIFSSFGYDEINSIIIEMQKPSLATAWGIVLFITIAIMALIAVLYKKKAFTTRFVLLYFGTLLMAMLTAKSIAYFIIGGIPAFSYLLKDAEIYLTIDEGKRDAKERKKLIVLVALFVAMLGVLGAVVANQSTNTNSEDKKMLAEYESLDEIVEILDKENKDNVILFADFNQGQYFEFKGYHPYIDGRAELFLKDNSKEFNYLKEYNELNSAKLYYKDFVDKYGFTYLVVEPNSSYLMTSLSHDDDYEVVYESEHAKLFKLKK